MNNHQLFQTVSLVVLCILGVLLTRQLSDIGDRYDAVEASKNAALDRATMLKSRGEARISAGDRALGIEYLSAALAIDSADETLRARIAELQAESLLAQPAALNNSNALTMHALFQQVIESQGGKSPIAVRVAFGKTLSYRGLLDEAKAVLDEAIKLAPNSAEAILFRGDIHMQERQWQAGLDQFEKALKLDAKNALSHFGRGLALMELKQYKEAVAPLNEAAKALNAIEPWLKLARTQALLKSWEDAEISYARAEVLKPNSAKLDPLYATVLAQRDKKPQAIQVAAARAKLTGDPTSYLQMGNWYLDLQQFENALPIFRQLRKLDEKESDYDCKYALAHERTKKLKKAVFYYEKCRDKAEGVDGRTAVLNFANNRLAALAQLEGTPAENSSKNN